MTEDTRREKNRAISMFQMIPATGRQIMKANRTMPRRLCSCLKKSRVTSALSPTVATWLLQLLWDVIGGFMGTSQVFLISGGAGTLDYVSLCNRVQVWVCVGTMVWWQSEVGTVDLSFYETSLFLILIHFLILQCVTYGCCGLEAVLT